MIYNLLELRLYLRNGDEFELDRAIVCNVRIHIQRTHTAVWCEEILLSLTEYVSDFMTARVHMRVCLYV